MRVHSDSALRASVRYSNRSALPCHPRGERAHFIEAHVLMVTDATLSWSASDVVLNPKAFEHFDRSVVHLDRDGHEQLTFRHAEHSSHALVELEQIGSNIELLSCYVRRIK